MIPTHMNHWHYTHTQACVRRFAVAEARERSVVGRQQQKGNEGWWCNEGVTVQRGRDLCGD